MKLATCNVSDELRTELSLEKNYGWVSQTDGDILFVDWLPTSFDVPGELLKQVKMIERFVKDKKPIILFDRFLSLSFKEQKFLKKTKVFFLEPALNYRRDFSYQPCWIEVPASHLAMDISPFDKKKKIDIAFLGNPKGKLDSIEKCIHSIQEYNDHLTIGFKHLDMEGVETDFEMEDCKTTVMMYSEKEERIGYLDPNLANYLKAAVIPLGTQKYFSLLNPEYTRTNANSNVNSYSNYGYGTVWGIYERIHNWYPEMRIQNTAQNIAQIGEKLLK